MCKCNNNNNTVTTTECHVCAPKPCKPPVDCSCPVFLSTSCITYNGDDLECSGIESGLPLNQTLQALDAYICEVISDINATISLVNVGTGKKLYAGIDTLGKRKIRSLITVGELLTSTENTEDVTLTIDETKLSQFVKDNQKTYSADNVGTDPLRVNVYKDSTTVDNNTQFNFRSVVTENLGAGKSFLRDIQQNTDELNVRVKTLVSDNLTITATDEEVRIETPMTASIPALYVNDLYQPTYQEWLSENSSQNGGTPVIGFQFIGKGTLSQPFTDTRVYTLNDPITPPVITANTAIQNALDGDTVYSYVGNLTRLNPQRKGQKIQVQNNNLRYTFNGDFDYSNLYVKIGANVNCTNTDYLVDMDNTSNFDSENARVTIDIEGGYLLNLIDSLGLKNSGNTSTTPPQFDTSRIIVLQGEGTLCSTYNGVDVLNRYIFNGDGNNNDGQLHFYVSCKVRADYQGVYFTKNKMRIDFYNVIRSGLYLGSVNTALKAFHMTGGQVRFYEKGGISISAETSGRTYGITFEPTGLGIGNCIFRLNSGKITGAMQYCFAKLNNESVQFLVFNSPSGEGFATVIPGTLTITNGLFENLGVTKWNVDFKNNVFSYTGIDFTKVDLTGGNAYSAINFIGNSVVESLVAFDDRAAAISAGIPLYSAYLKTEGVAYPTTIKWVRDIVLPA